MRRKEGSADCATLLRPSVHSYSLAERDQLPKCSLGAGGGEKERGEEGKDIYLSCNVLLLILSMRSL